jgi:hypothetical protein
MISAERANAFARAWIDAWNAHDLTAILSHYADDVEFFSPFVVRVLNDPAGVIRGKAALAAYFSRGLERFPELHFELHRVLAGVQSVTLYYRSVDDLQAAEVMELDASGKVRRALCHYAG